MSEDENAGKRLSTIERAVIDCEETAKEILRKVSREDLVGDRAGYYYEQVNYYTGCAAGLREALFILRREEA